MLLHLLKYIYTCLHELKIVKRRNKEEKEVKRKLIKKEYLISRFSYNYSILLHIKGNLSFN